jgi:hypothetical protein
MIHALFLLLAASAPQAAADPLAPVRAGKLQCANPNIEKKTCMALSSYKLNADATYEATTTLLIAPQPQITMQVKSAGKIVDGQFCGPIRKEDFDAATLTMDGAAMDPSMAAAIQGQVVAAITPMLGKTGCTRETPDGATLKAEVTLDGVARPEMTQRVLWVSAANGYKLGL